MHIICLKLLELKVFVHFLSGGGMSGDGWWEGIRTLRHLRAIVWMFFAIIGGVKCMV
jgi:hypothetical protein